MKDAAADVISGATPLALSAAVQSGGAVEAALSAAGYSFSTLFFGRYPGSIGATSTLMCLLGVLFLIAIGVANYRIVVGGVLGILATGWLLNLLASDAVSPFWALNPFYHLVMGGAAFGIAFMATDPVSAPDMNAAKWIYGYIIGSLTVVVRVFNPAFPEGVMLAILFMNLFAPLLDHVVVSLRLKKRVPNV
jgi:Na+-transporting NADH:ubiquinone oxidoreductase subunit B